MMPSPYQPNPEFAEWCENLDRMAPQHHTINPIPASLERYLREDPDALTGTARGIMAEMEQNTLYASLVMQDDEPVIDPADLKAERRLWLWIWVVLLGVCCALAYGCHEMSVLHHWAWIDGGRKWN